MNISLIPRPLTGTVCAIGSKSDIHRLLICAALSDQPTKVTGLLHSEDIDATVRVLRALGTNIDFTGSEAVVTPGAFMSGAELDCAESGSTLRFMLPVASAVVEEAGFLGHGRLPERPIDALLSAMKSGGVTTSRDKLPLTTHGRLKPGLYPIPGNVSSQYITGLLMALSVVPGESRIALTTELQSASYIDMTLSTLARFGAQIEKLPDGYLVQGRKYLSSPGTILSDGDWSNAAFFACAGALHGPVTTTGLYPDSLQGDRKIADILTQFGADVSWTGTHSLRVAPGNLHGITVDLGDIPDMLPALSIVAAHARGETHFVNAARLRLKESDRLATVAAMIRNLGGHAEETPDSLTVYGTGLTGGTVDGAGDHRIVMAAAIAASCAKDAVTILGAEAVNKSYPHYFSDYRSLGGQVNGI